MVIKSSTSREVRTLVAALGSADEVAREGAIARLAVIGARAVDQLVAAYNASADRRVRLAMLRALETVADDRAAPVARRALIEGGDNALAAVAILRRLVASPRPDSSASALDALVATALDAGNARAVRLAAVEAVEATAGAAAAPLIQELRDETTTGSPNSGQHNEDAERLAAIWQDAADGRLWGEPPALRAAISAHASAAPLNTLRKMIDAIRSREAEDAAASAAWRGLRGALHQALALRGSRVALYDLRDTLADADPAGMTPSFLAALQLVGDESCLEPLAALWERTSDERRRHQLQTAFDIIVRRERIGPRHKARRRMR